MLTLKNPFAKTAPTDTPLPSPQAMEASVKGKQLLRGRTKARVESLRAEVATARTAVTDVKRTIGERRDSDLDITAVTEELRQVEGHLQALEAALAFAIQKDEAAQADLRHGETEARREALRELLAQLADEGRWWDARHTEDGRRAAETNRVIQRIQAFGISELNSRLITSIGWFKALRVDSCESMPGCWTGTDLHKARLPWSPRLPDPSEADRLIK